MRFVQVSAALLLSVSIATPVVAQSGPAERPPVSFTGQQYVDSRGCVFLRAGYGGQVQWVPRITASRKPLCGYPPSLGAVTIEVAEAAPAAPVVEAPPVVVAAPAKAAARLPTASQPVRVAAPAPVVMAPALAPAPAPQVRVAPQVQVAAGPGPGKIGCYKSAPVAMVVPLRGGGTAVVCTRGDGTMNGWRPPVYPKGAPIGASLNLPQVAGYQMNGKGQIVIAGDTPTPPEGYRTAWTDDRLNPARSLGTAQGRVAQDQIWSQKVPAQQVAAAPKTKAKTSVSTNTNAAAGTFYVQVGTFGVPNNASGAAARLSALGLPTAKGNLTKNGKALQIVYAGPFASQAAAQDALSAARAAGFGDAFIR